MSPFRNFNVKERHSFTLIELLVVLAIVAILSVVVILTLNPSELLKQARDSNRLSDLSTLNTALSAYSADVNGGFMGTSSVVYVSIPDTTSTCSNLGLPTLPSGWAYNCVTTTSTKLSDGRGWIPVNFSNISFGSPLSSLPVDPTNTTSSGNYYTYVSGGSFQLSSKLESQKYFPEAVKTNDYDPGLYLTGNNTSIAPFVGGLVGFWDFEEGVGSTTSTDRTGTGKNGTWNGTGIHYTASAMVGSFAGIFGGSATSDHLYFGVTYTKGWPRLSYGGWFNTTSTAPSICFMCESAGSANFMLVINRSTVGKFDAYMSTNGTNPSWQSNVTGVVNDGNWHHVIVTYDGAYEKVYLDGAETFSVTGTGVSFNLSTYFYIGAGASGTHVAGTFFAGKADNLRLYSRALSAAEVLALYNATK